MATFNEIKTVRLRLADPAGFINILEVALPTNLPAVPEQQTAYRVQSTGYYMATALTSGALPADYTQSLLRVSDEYLANLIDTYGEDLAVCKAYSLIIAQLGNQLVLTKNTSGADSTEYTDLKVMLDYYKQLQKDCNDQNKSTNLNSTGRLYKSKQPEIAGGNI